MIRSVLGLFVFAVALCAYIVIRPGSEPDQLAFENTVAAPADVTRAVSESLLPGTPLPTEVTDANPIVTTPLPQPVIRTDNSTISQTTNNVLAGLGLQVEAPEISTDDPIGEMSFDALNNISASTGRDIAPREAAPTSALETLVVAALKEGRADAEIDELINTAAVSGNVTVPEVLVTSDGRVDTAVLLQAILNQAQIAAGDPAPAVPEAPTENVEVRVVQQVEEAQQYRFYTVTRGDSLGAIALKFYGSVEKFPVLFEANRNILFSPDQIRVGQRLWIPDLDDQV